jgi:LacI family transcriptional regulator
MAGKIQKSRRATIIDVAREANVSYSTVSRVVNKLDHVKPDKRERVLAAMERLGYIANQQARSLKGAPTQVIGLLVHDLGDAYIVEILRGIDEEISAAGYDLMLFTTHRQKAKESGYVQTLTQGMIDGLLLSLPLDPGSYLRMLHEEQFPYVVLDHHGFDDFSPTVTATNWQGAFDATNYLLDLGHTRIGFIMGAQDLSSANERFQGYQDALSQRGIAFEPELTAPGQFHRAEGYQAAKKLLSLEQPPTAIFAANDMSAFGAMDACRDAGLTIPQDISIIGFDDVPSAATIYPPLTTVHQPIYDMGRMATQLLTRLIQDPVRPSERVVVDTQLVIRQSCQPPKRV